MLAAMHTVELRSPAKINLFLDVLGRRSDGYHDIVTVFEKIDLCDRLRITSAASGIEISCNLADLPVDEGNLVHRAASALKRSYAVSGGAKIHIEKVIPLAAGLGGGSSNAATALFGLNKLWDLGLREQELAEMGKKIGADVPFFIFNHAFALGSGRGDRIRPIRSQLGMWHVIISPPARLLTKEIYENANFILTDKRTDVKMIVRAIEQNDIEGIKKNLYNALEPVANKRVTEISRACGFVKKKGFNAIGVSGSGPTIFVLTAERKEAEALKKDCLCSFAREGSADSWKIFVAGTFTGNI